MAKGMNTTMKVIIIVKMEENLPTTATTITTTCQDLNSTSKTRTTMPDTNGITTGVTMATTIEITVSAPPETTDTTITVRVGIEITMVIPVVVTEKETQTMTGAILAVMEMVLDGTTHIATHNGGYGSNSSSGRYWK